MQGFSDRIRNRLKKSVERERNLERPIEAFSQILWPYAELKLVLYIGILAFLDYISTFSALKLSGNSQIFEAGLLAKWALQTGGFPGLFLMDVAAIGALVSVAVGVRFLYTRLGFRGFGHAAFIFILIPYFIFIIAVVFNNILLTFI